MKFDGKPIFLIDAKLFPGSSGSIVITKPTASPVDEWDHLRDIEKHNSLSWEYILAALSFKSAQ